MFSSSKPAEETGVPGPSIKISTVVLQVNSQDSKATSSVGSTAEMEIDEGDE